jgi:hypothetical protein
MHREVEARYGKGADDQSEGAVQGAGEGGLDNALMSERRMALKKDALPCRVDACQRLSKGEMPG